MLANIGNILLGWIILCKFGKDYINMTIFVSY